MPSPLSQRLRFLREWLAEHDTVDREALLSRLLLLQEHAEMLEADAGRLTERLRTLEHAAAAQPGRPLLRLIVSSS